MVDISISALVRRLREHLGLTQEQFAHRVGVTFSTVNQWENGRRRPQPFLYKRLLEIEASMGKNQSPGHMTRGEAKAFKRRWEIVNTAEKEELATTPVAHKFRQLMSLMTTAGKLGWTSNMETEEAQVRDRWALLRRCSNV
jgi:putative transcriptional regulator